MGRFTIVLKLSIAIMHSPWVPQRRAWVEEMVERLDHPVTIVEAIQGAGIWDTSSRAWKAIGEGATHHLVLQDDMMPTPNTVANILAGISYHPSDPISWWTMRKKAVKEAVEAGHAWVKTRDGIYGGSTSLPVHIARQFPVWADELIDHDYKHDDRRLCAYLFYAEPHPVWMSVPSLLEHVAPSDSIVGHNHPGRVATVLNASGTLINWNTASTNGGSTYYGKDIPWKEQP